MFFEIKNRSYKISFKQGTRDELNRETQHVLATVWESEFDSCTFRIGWIARRNRGGNVTWVANPALSNRSKITTSRKRAAKHLLGEHIGCQEADASNARWRRTKILLGRIRDENDKGRDKDLMVQFDKLAIVLRLDSQQGTKDSVVIREVFDGVAIAKRMDELKAAWTKKVLGK